MLNLKQAERDQNVAQFYNEHIDRGKLHPVQHFELMGLNKRMIYRAIKRVEDGTSLDRKNESGRAKLPPSNVRSLVKLIKEKVETLKTLLPKSSE